jgi:hypothetical protein
MSAIAALGCGLEAHGAWDAGNPCSKLFNRIDSDQDRGSSKPLPFDAGRNHALYMGRLGEVGTVGFEV